eukprot:2411599-Amphidinium_carterae.1
MAEPYSWRGTLSMASPASMASIISSSLNSTSPPEAQHGAVKAKRKRTASALLLCMLGPGAQSVRCCLIQATENLSTICSNKHPQAFHQ